MLGIDPGQTKDRQTVESSAGFSAQFMPIRDMFLSLREGYREAHIHTTNLIEAVEALETSGASFSSVPMVKARLDDLASLLDAKFESNHIHTSVFIHKTLQPVESTDASVRRANKYLTLGRHKSQSATAALVYNLRDVDAGLKQLRDEITCSLDSLTPSQLRTRTNFVRILDKEKKQLEAIAVKMDALIDPMPKQR